MLPLLQSRENGAAGPLRREAEGVPAHVGHGQPRRNHVPDGAHLPRNEAQAGVLPVLKGALQEELHPQADAQDGLACGSGLQYRLRHAGGPQPGRCVAESPHAGEDHVAGRPEDRSVPGDHGLPADGRQGALEGEQVTHPVVDDGDHASPPSNRISTALAWASRPSLRANRLTFR